MFDLYPKQKQEENEQKTIGNNINMPINPPLKEFEN